MNCGYNECNFKYSSCNYEGNAHASIKLVDFVLN